MSIETWGMLPKSQESSQTIEERIAEMIAEHEADPEAHTGENESLAAHRANEVLDHLADSIVEDKLAPNQKESNFYRTNFRSLEEFTFSGTGSRYSQFKRFVLNSGSTTGYKSLMHLEDPDFSFFNSDLYILRFTLYAEFSGSATKKIWFGINIGDGGPANFGDPDSSIGFKVESGKLYAVYSEYDTAVVATEIYGSVPSGPQVYHVEYYPGSYIRWYVNGELEHEVTTNLPDIYAGYVFGASCEKAGGSSVALLTLYDLLLERQELP